MYKNQFVEWIDEFYEREVLKKNKETQEKKEKETENGKS